MADHTYPYQESNPWEEFEDQEIEFLQGLVLTPDEYYLILAILLNYIATEAENEQN